MREWLSKLGHETSGLNVIHITGTKGKGSTAALTDSLIRARFHRLSRSIKVGLYTSPHLITERERIRINFEPLSEEQFTKYFFEVWDTLRKNAADDGDMPGYLQLLALTSVHAFKNEAVDVAIYEVHAGGRKDATNIFDSPIACGFTTIGLDHVDLLGGTIQSIAWQKSGIMKSGRPAYSVIQELVTREVLENEAAVLGCPLEFVDTYAHLPEHPRLRLPAQKQNASLAIRLANAYLSILNDELSADDIIFGTSRCDWPGRLQMIRSGPRRWALDTAHNTLSLPVALTWFESEVRQSDTPFHELRRVLIFGHESKRDRRELIATIVQFCEGHGFLFDLVILSSYERYGLRIYDSVTEEDARIWQTMQPSAQISCASSLAQAIMMAQELGDPGVWTLITGSTYLVGEALALLQAGVDGTSNDHSG